MERCGVGGPLKIKIQSNIFDVKHDGNNDFSINRKTFVQEQVKDSFFSRQDFDLMKPQCRKFIFKGMDIKHTFFKKITYTPQ